MCITTCLPIGKLYQSANVCRVIDPQLDPKSTCYCHLQSCVLLQFIFWSEAPLPHVPSIIRSGKKPSCCEGDSLHTSQSPEIKDVGRAVMDCRTQQLSTSISVQIRSPLTSDRSRTIYYTKMSSASTYIAVKVVTFKFALFSSRRRKILCLC
jgi:hypothetical protein